MIYFTVLFLALMLNIYSIILSLNIKEKLVRYSALMLLGVCTTRYLTLYIYSFMESPEHLYYLRNLFLASIVALPVVSYWSVRLLYRGGLNIYDKGLGAVFTAVFGFVTYRAPQGIITTDNGYTILYGENWLFIITMAMCIFGAFMIYLSFNYLIKERVIKIKLTYLLYFISFIALIAEQLLTMFQRSLLPQNIIAETLILTAIITSLKIKKI